MLTLPRIWKLLPGPITGKDRSVLGRNPRRAWKNLLWAGVLFLALQLMLGVLAERYPRVRDPFYGDKYVKLAKRVRNFNDPFIVVMLGSSRTGLGFHGKLVEEQLSSNSSRPVVAFNYGIPASGPVTHLVYLKRLLNSAIKPNHLLLEILPSMLADGHGGPIERNWFHGRRLTFQETAMVSRHGYDGDKVASEWQSTVYLPVYALRFELLCRVVPGWLPWQLRFDWSRSTDECGWGKMEHQSIPADQYARGLARAKLEYAPILSNWKPGGGACSALTELLQLCKENDIPVTLVLMPEAEAFRSWYPTETNRQLTEYLQRLPVPLVDGRTWLKDDAFTDGHHMLAQGATDFTMRLNTEAIRPQFIGQR